MLLIAQACRNEIVKEVLNDQDKWVKVVIQWTYKYENIYDIVRRYDIHKVPKNKASIYLHYAQVSKEKQSHYL